MDNVTNKLKLFDHMSSQVNVLEEELKNRLSKVCFAMVIRDSIISLVEL